MPAPHTGGDNASYIALARSLLDLGEYREIYDPLAPPHTQYPPVFPGILALAMLAGLAPWVQLKALIAIASAAGVACAFLWIRRRRHPLLALGVGLILALSPGLLELGHWVLSDVPFFAFTMLALWAFERLGRRDRARHAIAIAATTLAYFTRSAGLPLVVAAFAWLALRRRFRQLAALAAVLVPLALLWWLRARAQGGVDYAAQFWLIDPYDPAQGRVDLPGLLARGIDNGIRYVTIHLPILLTGAANALSIAAGIALLGFGAFGWALRVRRPGVAELFLPLYLGLICLWPAVWSGERFLLPAFPLLLAYGGEGVLRLAMKLTPRRVALAGTAVAALLIALSLPGTAAQVRVGSMCTSFYRLGDRYPCLPAHWREYFDAAEWAGRALPDDASFVTRKPRLWWALSGRTAIIYPLVEDADTLFQAARRAGADYLVLDPLGGLTQTYVVPVVLARPEGFCLLHATQTGTAILGIRENAAGLPVTDTASGGVNFPICPEEYWRDPAEREAAMRRLGITR